MIYSNGTSFNSFFFFFFSFFLFLFLFLQNDDAARNSGSSEGESGSDDSDSESDEDEDDEATEPDNEQEEDVVVLKKAGEAEVVVDEDFEKEFSRMMGESLVEAQKRETSTKGPAMDVGIPMHLLGSNDKRAPPKQDTSNVTFSLLLKKGNKQQVCFFWSWSPWCYCCCFLKSTRHSRSRRSRSL